MPKIKKSVDDDKNLVKNELTVVTPLKGSAKIRFKLLRFLFLKQSKKKQAVVINFEWRRRATKKIINQLLDKNIDYFYFYTAINNIFYILDHGIQPATAKTLLPNQKYIVWSFLEKEDYLALEWANTSRNEFWNWCLEHKIDLATVAVFYLDLKRLYETTTRDWEIDNFSQRIIIRENISTKAILGILIKDFDIYKRLKLYLDSQKSHIKLFYGENGAVKFGKELK